VEWLLLPCPRMPADVMLSSPFGTKGCCFALQSRAVVRFYNKCDTAEQVKGRQSVKMTRLSGHRFRSNEVGLALEPVGLQPGFFVVATGAAPTNREALADEFAPTAGEHPRMPGAACALLLAPTRGGTSEPAAATWPVPTG